MLYWRIAAVSLTVLFAATLVWLYGVRTSLIWAAAMAAFLLHPLGGDDPHAETAAQDPPRDGSGARRAAAARGRR